MSTPVWLLIIALCGCLALNLWLWRRLHAAARRRAPSAGPATHGDHQAGTDAITVAGDPQGDGPAWAATPAFPPLFHAAVAAFDAGLVVVNPERAVLFLNSQAEVLLDAAATFAQGQGLITLVRDHQIDHMVADVLSQGEEREATIQPLLSSRTLRLRCVPLILDTQTAGALLLIRDVTQISMLERSRRELVANVSHELRTPLASLKLLVETLQSEPPPPVAQRMLGQMLQEIDAVTQLVNELHELSQIESGRVTLQLSPASLDAVIERALERIKPQADRKQLTVAADLHHDQTPALMDDDRVGQILLNLLHNAVKFTAPDGKICVRSTIINLDEAPDAAPPGALLAQRASSATTTLSAPSVTAVPAGHPLGTWIVVSISDTGIGIPAQDLPRVFERFYKVDRSRNRNAGGTGLGLAIAKHLVEGHGGRLWADSQEGRGSTFYLTLPVA